MPLCPACGRENPDDSQFCGSCGAPLAEAAPPRDVRKTVTVVFCDVTGSTALGERLDPESLRRVMGRYFDEMQAVVERHGGTVEKFIGDAIMAVFGVPVLHEDDALRAVRAASEMRDRLDELNEELARDWGVRIQVRTGVNTGEVVAGGGTGGQRLATGDAVNVAKRLEEAAPAGEILLGEPTYRLVRDAVKVSESEPLELKGKSEPVGGYRLLSVEADAPGHARRLDSPMVGRERERTLLRQAYDRAVEDRACQLFTVLGAAGVGKSRLVAEFLDELGAQANAVIGRCLPYGEGITFWPLLEVVRRLYGDEPIRAVAAELGGDKDAELIAERIAAAVGLAEGAGGSEETSWAFRRLFETTARDRPLVVVFDDIQWGEPTFLQLIEHIADLSRDAPILLLCMARPELLDGTPGWGGGKFNATSVLLEPLDERESIQLLDNLLGQQELAAIRNRVAQAAEGNPLFVEEMLAMLIDDGVLERVNGGWAASGDLESIAVPPSIQALLAARLERLAEPERLVVECASVEGKVFHRGAVARLFGDQVDGHLHALVRKELVRPDATDLPGQDAYRFRHLLIRDAAYESMPKERRAELHSQFVGWLEVTVADRVAEYEEVLGYHLEQAYRYRVELGPPDANARSLAVRAGEHLAAAGERANSRGDAPAAISLIDRAAELLPPDSPRRPKLLCDLGMALTDRGDFERAETVLSEAATGVEKGNDVGVAATAELRLQWVRLLRGALMEESQTSVERAIQSFEEIGDGAQLAEALLFRGIVLTWRGRCAEGEATLERAVAEARRAGAHRVAARSLSWLLVSSLWGPRSVSEGLELTERVLADPAGNRQAEGLATVIGGAFRASSGQWDEGQRQVAAGRAMLEELGQDVTAASTSMALSRAQLMAGRAGEAEHELRRGYKTLKELGEKGYLSTVAAMLAVSLCAQGRHDEAAPYAEEAREIGAADDLTTQAFWRMAYAEVLARRGEFERAHQLIEEALRVLEGTDMFSDIALIHIIHASIFRMEGKRDLARPALEEAIRLCKEKEDVAAVGWLEGEVADLSA